MYGLNGPVPAIDAGSPTIHTPKATDRQYRISTPRTRLVNWI